MAKPWAAVEQSESYRNLSPQAKVQAKAQYWDSVVTTKPNYTTLDAESKTKAKTEFFGGSTESGDTRKPFFHFGPVSESEFAGGERRFLGNIFERPGAAIRSGLLGRGFSEGANLPQNVPRFQDLALDKFYGATDPFIEKAERTFSPAGQFLRRQRDITGNVPSAVGLAGDILTNPADVLGLLAGKAPVGRAFAPEVARQLGRSRQTFGEVVSATKPAQAVERFVTKERRLPRIGINEKNLDSYIVDSVRKGLRPSMSGKKFGGQIDQYNRKSVEAVKDIVANKDKLGLVDELGNPEARTPKNLKESVDAIDNLKQSIWSEVEQATEKTGQVGVRINGQDVAKKIAREFNQSKYKLNPDLRSAAMKEAEILANAGDLKPSDIDFQIKAINQRLTNYFKRGIYETGKSQDVDAFLARELNKTLDDVINKETGTQYKALKQRYGNLKTIEEDLVKRYGVDARKNIKGFFDLGDIWSDGQIIRGIFSVNPAEIASGLVQKGMVKTFKALNDPNRIIRDMFKNVDKAYKPTPRFNAEILEDIPLSKGPFISGPTRKQALPPSKTKFLPSPKTAGFQPFAERIKTPKPLITPEMPSGPTITPPVHPETLRFMARGEQIASEEELKRKLLMLDIISRGKFGRFIK